MNKIYYFWIKIITNKYENHVLKFLNLINLDIPICNDLIPISEILLPIIIYKYLNFLIWNI